MDAFWTVAITSSIVIPEAAKRLSGIHSHGMGYGFRACAFQAHPGMTGF
jgi:hypothetical protein